MAPPAPARRVRVAHWGTGATGSFALRAVLARPDLELVGLVVTDPDKVGRDAGELVGIGPSGVLATHDPTEVLEHDPECLLYAGTGADRELEAAEDMAVFLRRGVDVATISLISMVYPAAGPPDVRAVLDAACAEGDASFYDSGSSPGLMSADMVLLALSCAGRVDTVRIQELVDNSRYPVPEAMRASAGMGQPMGYVPGRVTSGQIERWWGPLVHLCADHLGLHLDPLVLEWETAPAPRDIETAYGGVPEGTIAGLWWRVVGRVDGAERVVVEHLMRAAQDVAPEWEQPPQGSKGGVRCRILGDPTLQVDMTSRGVAGSLGTTALAAVNAIPALVRAPSGLHGPGDLGSHTTRGDAGGASPPKP